MICFPKPDHVRKPDAAYASAARPASTGPAIVKNPCPCPGSG